MHPAPPRPWGVLSGGWLRLPAIAETLPPPGSGNHVPASAATITPQAGAEALFYSAIRPQLTGIGAPAGYFASRDPKTCRSMILTEDIAAARGAMLPDLRHSFIKMSTQATGFSFLMERSTSMAGKVLPRAAGRSISVMRSARP